MRRLALALLCALLSCHAPVDTTPTGGAALELPLLSSAPTETTTMRLLAVGDAGAETDVHQAAFAGLRAMLPTTDTPAAILVPGDVTYPAGLPASCPAAKESLERDYLDEVPGLPIYAVPGNHDHGDIDKGADFGIALRDAALDCDHAKEAAPRVGWDAASCGCEERWHVPTGAGVVGTAVLVMAGDTRTGFTLVTYDSQAALADPEGVAQKLEATIDAQPANQRLIVMGHHPLKSFGPHGTKHLTAQDNGTSTYAPYERRFGELFRTRASRIALLLFGHDHTLQFLPGSPPQLVSGAGAKTSDVAQAPPDAFVAGDTPGLAVLDLQANGEVALTLLWKGAPRRYVLPPP